jgi:cellulose synthase/poly-beta-1,6-N-acetylglucosamine synthase-like glycosyltransferase
MIHTSNLAPICLFVYNRPWHTKQTLEALTKSELASESKIFVFCDGPKDPSNSEDINAINAVHRIVREVKGFKDVKYFESDINKGLGRSIIDGVSYILESHERVIILEDDHVVHKDFLKYMNFYLREYNNNKQIMHVGAFQRNSYLQFFLPKVYVTRYMDCWGWGTWADSWRMLILDFKLFDDYFSLQHNANRYNFNKLDHHTYLEKNRLVLKTWAVFWHATIAIHNGLSIMPKYSYVKNIGNDGSGTNEVVKTPELASNFINEFKPFQPKLKETILSELYIQDAYAKRSKKRFTTIKKLIHDLISSVRNVLIRKI